MIELDMNNRKITLEISDEEMERRRQAWPGFEPKIKRGYFARYSASSLPLQPAAL